ncbi:hypothetical protein DM02DRAFT_667002 [Periconia macrospinosa]|uniref:Pal1-domain-containing protein n=1 Tax=Periconia macrospinosa TaxID=97972 RepID=A0A2V1ED51_9PLEO|nr:hypothetical protein DM02DRAFT_667002 [Periconia macrospinosa]
MAHESRVVTVRRLILWMPQQPLHRVTLDRPGLTDEWHARLEAVYEQQKQQAPNRKLGRSGNSSPSEQGYHPSRKPTGLYVHTDAANKRHFRDSDGSTYPITLEDPRLASASPHSRPIPVPYNRDSPTAKATRRALGFGRFEEEGLTNYTQRNVNMGSGRSPPAINPPSNHRHLYKEPNHNYYGRQRQPREVVFADEFQVPRRYVDEMNRRWHVEDEDLNADQYMADIMPNAPWRMAHMVSPGAGFGILPLNRNYCACGATCDHSPQSAPVNRYSQATSEKSTSTAGGSNSVSDDPSLVSHFSDDSDAEEERILYHKLKKKLKKLKFRD